MAMSVLSDRPPPLGTSLRNDKIPRGKAPKLGRSLQESVINQIMSTPMGKDMVVDMTAIRAAVTEAYQLDKEDTPPFQPSVVPKQSASGGGQGTTGEWHPSWQFKEGELAWINLLRNAHHVKPVGRKFTPDPNYSGQGECPLPQREPPYSPIKYDNVVPFEDALDAARAAAQRKSDNSFRSRGSAGMFEPVVRDYQKIASPVKEDKETGEPPITKPQSSSPAYDMMKAANSPTKVSTSPSDIGPDIRDIHLQALLHLPVNIALELHSQGYAQLSPSYEAWYHHGNLKVGCNALESGVYEVTFDELDFFQLLEMGGDSLIPQDMVSDCLLSDSACEYIFSLSSPLTNQFLDWSGDELEAHWNKRECSKNNQPVTPMDSSYLNPPTRFWEVARWHEEYAAGLERLGASQISDEEIDEQADDAQHLIMHREYLELMAITSTPWVKEVSKSSQYQERWDNLYSARMERLSRSDDNRYQLWLLDHLNPECDREHDLFLERNARKEQFFNSVPMIVSKTEEGTAVSRAVGKVRKKAKGFFNRVKTWLMEPVLVIGAEDEEVAPVPTPTPEEVRLASKAIFKEVMKGSLVEKDDRESIQWLQEPNRPLEDLPNNEFAQRVIHVIQNADEQDIYSVTGIYLGKKTKFEQVNQGSGMILLNAKVPPAVA